MKYKVGDKIISKSNKQYTIIGKTKNNYYASKFGDSYAINDNDIDHGKTTQLSLDTRESDLSKDNVNHPLHYTKGSYEVIDVITDVTRDMVGIDAVCVGNIIKYVARYKYKNGIEDLEKARWYLNRLIEHNLKKSSIKD
jgi:hypothetical protein